MGKPYIVQLEVPSVGDTVNVPSNTVATWIRLENDNVKDINIQFNNDDDAIFTLFKNDVVEFPAFEVYSVNCSYTESGADGATVQMSFSLR